MSFTVTGSGKHVECGGLTTCCDAGVRCKCKKCGEEETWEQAARHWHSLFKKFEPEVHKLRHAEKKVKAFSTWVQERYDAGLEDWDEFRELVRGEMAEYIGGLQS